MHPMERLRAVARAGGAPDEILVPEAARALGSVAGDPRALRTACRQMLSRQSDSAALVWLAARMVVSDNPRSEAARVVEELRSDPTARELAALLPDDATVLVVGASDVVAGALSRRGDLSVLLAETVEGAFGLSIRLAGDDLSVADVPGEGIGSAAAASDLVVLDASVIGPDEVRAPLGSLAAASVAARLGIPVWAVGGVGVWLPEALYRHFVGEPTGRPWEQPVESVPRELVTQLVGPVGFVTGTSGEPWCPAAVEVLPAGC